MSGVSRAGRGALLGLVAAMLLVGCRQWTTDALDLLPANTNLVMAADVTRARGSGVWKLAADLVDDLTGDEDASDDLTEALEKLDDLADAAGVSLPDDLPTLVFGARLQDDGDFAGAAIFAFSRDVDVDDLVAFFEEEGLELDRDELKGFPVYSLGGRESLTFLKGRHLVIGESEYVEDLVELAGGKGDNASTVPLLKDAVKSVNPKATAWSALLVDRTVADLLKSGPVSVLSDAVWIISTLHLADDAHLELQALFEREGNAADAADALDDLLGDAKSELRDLGDEVEWLSELFDDTDVRADKLRLTSRIGLSEDFLEDGADWVADEGLDGFGALAGGISMKVGKKSSCDRLHDCCRAIKSDSASTSAVEVCAMLGKEMVTAPFAAADECREALTMLSTMYESDAGRSPPPVCDPGSDFGDDDKVEVIEPPPITPLMPPPLPEEACERWLRCMRDLADALEHSDIPGGGAEAAKSMREGLKAMVDIDMPEETCRTGLSAMADAADAYTAIPGFEFPASCSAPPL